MSLTNIEWTDIVDNIFTVKSGGWWCRRISEGCDNCYAATLNQNSFFGGNHLDYSGNRPADLILRQDIIDGWARATRPKRRFVSSMTDIFGEWVFAAEAFSFLDGMLKAPLQTFQMLTKRPHIARKYILGWLKLNGLQQLPGHMWIGTSVENQKWADIRIPLLMEIPAAVRFLSCEPLLGPIDLRLRSRVFSFPKHITASGRAHFTREHLPFHWAILGGESGKGSRVNQIEWVESLVNQCSAFGVKAFVKQMGANTLCHNANMFDFPDSTDLVETDLVEGFSSCAINWKHPKGGDPAEWPADLRIRQFPGTARCGTSPATAGH
jgi:protein gp37